MNKQLLIIGKPHSSKTVFLSQFYSRLQKKKSKLSLYKAVDDLSPISGAREALANGDEPEATSTLKSEYFYLPIQTSDGMKIDLQCPEYGGEQVDGIIDNREVDKNWSEAIKLSDNWIFFIRLNSVNHSTNISSIEITKDNPPNLENDVSNEYRLSDQSSLIELLQLLLHYKGVNYHLKNQKIKLTVVLTCWDELNTNEKPKSVLESRLPLLFNFIESNWMSQFVTYLGLSALGFPLNDPENKEKYQIEGPESFGYLVQDDGQNTNDITELIIEAL